MVNSLALPGSAKIFGYLLTGVGHDLPFRNAGRFRCEKVNFQPSCSTTSVAVDGDRRKGDGRWSGRSTRRRGGVGRSRVGAPVANPIAE